MSSIVCIVTFCFHNKKLTTVLITLSLLSKKPVYLQFFHSQTFSKISTIVQTEATQKIRLANRRIELRRYGLKLTVLKKISNTFCREWTIRIFLTPAVNDDLVATSVETFLLTTFKLAFHFRWHIKSIFFHLSPTDFKYFLSSFLIF